MIQQPFNSSICGQCCLAHILGISLVKSLELVGHSKSTRYNELTRHFNHSRIFRGNPTAKSLCRVWYYDRPHNGHWILYKDNTIYDPSWGYVINSNDYVSYLVENRIGRIITHTLIL